MHFVTVPCHIKVVSVDLAGQEVLAVPVVSVDLAEASGAGGASGSW